MSQIDLTRLPGSGPMSAVDSPLRRLVVETMFAQGLTLEDVAVRGGLSIATVAALRSGGRGKRPRRDTLERLALGLGLSTAEVVAAASPVAQDAAPHDAVEQLVLRYFRRLSESDQDAVLAHLSRLATETETVAAQV